MPSGTTNAPPSDTPVPVLYRYTDGKQSWKTWLGGPDVHADQGLAASPDMNGDLVYSEKAGLYGAYVVVTDYDGDAAGHFGDSIQYVAKDGTLKTISGASSAWGCSHNTGIAFEEADEAPFASICAEDQGAIWLNTKTQGMTTDGVKISNENTTNGAGGEAMGGMSGSYSALARFAETSRYIFAWVSRGAVDVTDNEWMGSGYTHVQNRTNNRNVAISMFSDKYTMIGQQATSKVGAEDGDSQITWLTEGDNDCSNAHAATFGNGTALVTWEEISNPTCDFIAMGCRGEFAGTFYQQVDSEGKKVGSPLKSEDTYVAGDMVTMGDGRICWPYVKMDWDLSQAVNTFGGSSSSTTKSLSFACLSLSGSSSSSSSSSSSVNNKAAAATAATTSIKSQATTLVTKSQAKTTAVAAAQQSSAEEVNTSVGQVTPIEATSAAQENVAAQQTTTEAAKATAGVVQEKGASAEEPNEAAQPTVEAQQTKAAAEATVDATVDAAQPTADSQSTGGWRHRHNGFQPQWYPQPWYPQPEAQAQAQAQTQPQGTCKFN